MNIDVGEFITQFGKFKDIPTHEIEWKLEVAKTFCNPKKWGTRWKFGVMLLAAHLLEREWQQTAITASMAQSIAAGGSVSSPVGTDDDFKLTTYGAQYIQMRDILPSFGVSF